MNRSRLVRKWTEEKSIAAIYARLNPAPVVPELVHDDGRFRIYDAGGVLFLTGEVTDPRPALYKSATGWQALEPRLTDLAQEMNKLFPDKLPGKSSSSRTRLMRNLVGLTPKGFGLGDSALWLGLVTAKKDFDPAQPRDENGRWTDTEAGRPGTGPATKVSAQRHSAGQAAKQLRDWQANQTSRLDEFTQRYQSHPQFEALRAAHPPEMDEGNWQENPEPISVQETVQAVYSAWYTHVSATPISAAFQKLVAEKFGLSPQAAPSFVDLDGAMSQYGDLLKQMVDETYYETQKVLAEQGITEIEVVRGVRNLSPGVTTGFHGDVEISGNAISSWTTEMDRANRFASTPGMVLRATIPASKVFALGGHSLIGNQGEREVVVISDNLRGDLWAWDETSGVRPEGVWKMTEKSTLNINVDADEVNANWLHPTSLREQVAKRLGKADDFDEGKIKRVPAGSENGGQFAPSTGAPASGPSKPKINVPGREPEGQGDYEFKRPVTFTGPTKPHQPKADAPKSDAAPAAPKAPPKPWVPSQAERYPPKVVAKPFTARLGEMALANGTVFSVDEGDLLAAPVDAIVNAANAELSHGGGVAGAIRKLGGYAIQEASDRWIAKHGKASPKRAAATGGGSLPAKYIMHAVAPIYGDGTKGEAQDMEDAYFSAMRLAHLNKATSLAFPSLGTGIFGNPLSLGTVSALKAAQRFATEFPDTPLKNIHIVVRSEDKDTHEAFGNMINGRPVVDKPKPVIPDPQVWTRDWVDPKGKSGSKPGKVYEASAGGWYGGGRGAPKSTYTKVENAQGYDPGTLKMRRGAVGDPLIHKDDSSSLMDVAEWVDQTDSKMAEKVADLDAALYFGNLDLAREHYTAIPTEIKDMLPEPVRSVFRKPKKGVAGAAPVAQKPLPLAPSEPDEPKKPSQKSIADWAKGIQDRLKGKSD